LFLIGGVVLAQTSGGYDLTWWTVDGGGGSASGGGYSLAGTVGQADAAPPLTGGDYTLYSGFWAGGDAAPPACNEVTSVVLNQVTSSDIYTDTEVTLSADVAPDNAGKPYTYTIDYGDGVSTTATSSDDPLTTPITHTFTATGTYEVEIAVWNCDMSAAQAVTNTAQVVVNEQGVTCTPVTGVGLSLTTSSDIYTDTEVTFSADVAPDNAGKPYTYTIDYGDGVSTTATSSDDPLTTPITHTFTATGTYEVEIAVWNCDMSAAQAVTNTAQVVVNEQGVTCTPVTGVGLSLTTSSDIYTDTEVTFSADVAPDNAGKPYTYTIDYGDGVSTTATSSDDPLTTPLNHTFTATGTYEIEIAVWNCDMSAAQAVTDTVQVAVSERAEADHEIYLPLVARNR